MRSSGKLRQNNSDIVEQLQKYSMKNTGQGLDENQLQNFENGINDQSIIPLSSNDNHIEINLENYNSSIRQSSNLEDNYSMRQSNVKPNLQNNYNTKDQSNTSSINVDSLQQSRNTNNKTGSKVQSVAADSSQQNKKINFNVRLRKNTPNTQQSYFRQKNHVKNFQQHNNKQNKQNSNQTEDQTKSGLKSPLIRNGVKDQFESLGSPQFIVLNDSSVQQQEPYQNRNAFALHNSRQLVRPSSSSSNQQQFQRNLQSNSRGKKSQTNTNYHNKTDSLIYYDQESIEKIEQKLLLIDNMLSSNQSSMINIKQTKAEREKLMKEKVQKLRNAQMTIGQVQVHVQEFDIDKNQRVIYRDAPPLELNHDFSNEGKFLSQTFDQDQSVTTNRLYNSNVITDGRTTQNNFTSARESQRKLIFMQRNGQITNLSKQSVVNEDEKFQSQMLKEGELVFVNKLAKINEVKGLKGKKLRKNLNTFTQLEKQNADLNKQVQDKNLFDNNSVYKSLPEANEIIMKIQKKRPKSEYKSKNNAYKSYCTNANSIQYLQDANQSDYNQLLIQKIKTLSHKNSSDNFPLTFEQKFLSKNQQQQQVKSNQLSSNFQISLKVNQVNNFKNDSINQSRLNNQKTLLEQEFKKYDNVIIRMNILNSKQNHNFSVVGKTQSKPERQQSAQIKKGETRVETNKLLNQRLQKLDFNIPQPQNKSKHCDTQSFHNSDLVSVTSSFVGDRLISHQPQLNQQVNQNSISLSKLPKAPEEQEQPYTSSQGASSRRKSIQLFQARQNSQSRQVTNEGLNSNTKDISYEDIKDKNNQYLTSESNKDGKHNTKNEFDTNMNNSFQISKQLQYESFYTNSGNHNHNLLNKKYSAYSIGYSKPQYYTNTSSRDNILQNVLTQRGMMGKQQMDQQYQDSNTIFQTFNLNSIHNYSFNEDIQSSNYGIFNDDELKQLLSTQKKYQKLNRKVYETKNFKGNKNIQHSQNKSYSNDAYINKLEIKERIAQSFFKNNKSKDSIQSSR